MWNVSASLEASSDKLLKSNTPNTECLVCVFLWLLVIGRDARCLRSVPIEVLCKHDMQNSIFHMHHVVSSFISHHCIIIIYHDWIELIDILLKSMEIISYDILQYLCISMHFCQVDGIMLGNNWLWSVHWELQRLGGVQRERKKREKIQRE